jgi:hypothetical protein
LIISIKTWSPKGPQNRPEIDKNPEKDEGISAIDFRAHFFKELYRFWTVFDEKRREKQPEFEEIRVRGPERRIQQKR